MTKQIKLQVARYRPEQESEPVFDEYDVPCHRDWVVLDGLKAGDRVIVDNLARLRPGAAVTEAAKPAAKGG